MFFFSFLLVLKGFQRDPAPNVSWGQQTKERFLHCGQEQSELADNLLWALFSEDLVKFLGPPRFFGVSPLGPQGSALVCHPKLECMGVLMYFAKTKIVFLFRDNIDEFSLLLKISFDISKYINPCHTDDVRVELIHFFPRMHN